MQVKQKTVLVTGANRGIGAAIVRELLKHDVTKIYAGTRKVSALPDFKDKRVVPVELDITNSAQVKEAATKAKNVQILINNAGVATFGSILDPKANEHDMKVNYFGTLSVIQAFVPVLVKNGGGLIANVSSVVGLANMSMAAGYSASKAALFSATQAARVELAGKSIKVVGIFPGPIDTEMAKDFPIDKTSPEVTAENIVKGIVAGHEDIFPDPMSQQVSQLWLHDYKALEKQFASMASASEAA